MDAQTAADRPRCRCHDERMDWATDHYTCAVKRRARQLVYYHRKKHEAGFQLDRQLREMLRIRIRY